MRMSRGPISSVTNKRLRRGIAAAALSTVVAAAGLLSTAPVPAEAAGDFYRTPVNISGEPGRVLKSEPAPLMLQIPGVPNQWPGSAKRIMYTTTGQDGRITPVTGVVVEPTAPWSGSGVRPTVVIGPGTIGQGDQCAGSKLISFPMTIDPTKPSIGVNYTGLETYLLLLNGVRVVITDYVGMGTPGVHTYVNRLESGRAMIDAARAGLRASGAPKDSPIGFTGYSQGGGAAASAAELAESYAPELNVKATYAGAPPADLNEVIDQIDGTAIAGGIGYAVNGLTDRYEVVADVVETETNAAGKQALRTLSTQCIGDTALTYGFARTNSWTRTGEPLSAVIARHPEVAAVVDEQRIGTLKPNAPVLISGAINDDVIPYDQTRQLYRDWKAQGADVRLTTDTLPPIFPGLVVGHALPMVTGLLPATHFLLTELDR